MHKKDKENIVSSKKITVREIANYAEVSARTVSRYLNKNGYVGKDARFRIQKTIEMTGYYPNAMARNLRTKKTTSIGTVFYHSDYFAGFRRNFHRLLLSGLIESLGSDGYGIQILESCPEAKTKTKGTYYLDKIKSSSIDGLILTDSLLPEQEIIEIQKYDIPFVVVNRFLENLPHRCILGDDFAKGYKLAKFLFNRGHKIAYFGLPESFVEGEYTIKGILKAANECQGQFDTKDTIKNDKNVIEQMIKILEQKDGPTAVVCGTDEFTYWLAELLQCGVRVPPNFEYAGEIHDNSVLPAQQPVYVSEPIGWKLGFEAGNLLLSIINSSKENSQPTYVKINEYRQITNSKAELLKKLRETF